MHKAPVFHTNMHQIEQGLRLARGRNAYRGRVILQPDQHRILLEAEVRGNAPSNRWPWVILHLDVDPANIRYQIADSTIRLQGWDRLDPFLDSLLTHLRNGKPHIRTYMHRTEYK